MRPERQGASPVKRAKRPRRAAEPAPSGATAGVELAAVQTYLDHHRRVARDSLLRLLRAPLASLLTWAVIAIALALPAALFLMLSNVEQVSQSWTSSPRITLYLELQVGADQARQMQEMIRNKPQVEAVDYISPEQALEEFKAFSGLGEAIDYLGENPLPPVLVVTPAAGLESAAQMEALQRELAALPGVTQVQLDMEWVERLYSLMELVRRGILALGGLLAVAVLLVIGNTIRLAIESRREEIVVIKLVGGTDSFVRRPFLYTGVWYGLGGAILAWLLVFFWLLWLAGPVEELARLYALDFQLAGLGVESTLTLLGTGMLLGWCGARLAVQRHLDEIEPQ